MGEMAEQNVLASLQRQGKNKNPQMSLGTFSAYFVVKVLMLL